MNSILLEHPPERTVTGPSVLAFDDEYDTLEAYKELLENRGARVTAKTDGYETLECAGSGRFDGAIIDINDREGNPIGIEILRQFLERNPNAQALVVSAILDYREEVEKLGGIFVDKDGDSTEIREYGDFLLQRHKRFHEEKYVPRKLRELPESESGRTVETTVEHLSADGCTVSFYDDQQDAWMMLDVVLPKDLRPLIFPDTGLIITIHHDPGAPGQILGVSIPQQPFPDRPAGHDERLGLDGQPLPVPDDFNDPGQVARYGQALDEMFAPIDGPTEFMKEIEAEQDRENRPDAGGSARAEFTQESGTGPGN